VTRPTFERVLTSVPEVEHAVAIAHNAAVGSVDPDLLEPCRLRIAMLIGNDRLIEGSTDEHGALIEALPSWPNSPRFSAAQRACLALTEEFVIDVASSTDEALTAVSTELGEQAMADFVSALLVIEQRQRLSMMWERLGL
jgi:alkylhydroperoxidase family enzyme